MTEEQDHQKSSDISESPEDHLSEQNSTSEGSKGDEKAVSSEGGINVMALLCYLGILVLVPLLTDSKEESFVKFHLKQGLVLLIGWVIGMFIMAVPFIGLPLFPLIFLALVILSIIGIINVANGEKKKLPVVGELGDKFNL